MDKSAWIRALDLNLCSRCMLILLQPRSEDLLKGDEEISELVRLRLSAFGLTFSASESCCPSCIRLLCSSTLDGLVSSLIEELTRKSVDKEIVHIQVNTPPVLDLSRLTVRSIVTASAEKTFPYPSLNDIMERYASERLIAKFNVTSNVDLAVVHIVLQVQASKQLSLCQVLSPGSAVLGRIKKRRKVDAEDDVVGAGVEASQPLDRDESDEGVGYDLSRAEVDSMLAQLKQSSVQDRLSLASPIIAFFNSCKADSITSWSFECTSPAIFLFGRYRKLARDVPQAAWTMDGQRKGRNSVEEIVCAQVQETLQASAVQMHSCGREDIDVRCLGNGRPFVLRVENAKVASDPPTLDFIRQNLEQGLGLNKELDVEVLALKMADQVLWKQMQAVAEEKRKGYRCIVWTSKSLSLADLRLLESCVHPQQGGGEPLIQIIQKTPLRVLHRRSLIDRPRFIYSIRATPLNSHYFILDLVTSAGTYVKEFVHGDLGRTVPNVGSLLGCQADILQLDVVRLFDDFEGGGNYEALGCSPEKDTDSDGDSPAHMSWNRLSRMVLPLIHSKPI